MKKRGQVWVETVIYTLIAFALIGAVLGFIKPKIDQMKDKAVLEQQINILQEIDSVVISAMQGPTGNSRNIELTLKKGKLIIDSSSNQLIFETESKYQFSEPDKEVNVSKDIEAITIKKNNLYIVNLTREYSNYDIRYDEKDETKELAYSANPYALKIENKEITVGDGLVRITNFRLS